MCGSHNVISLRKSVRKKYLKMKLHQNWAIFRVSSSHLFHFYTKCAELAVQLK